MIRYLNRLKIKIAIIMLLLFLSISANTVVAQENNDAVSGGIVLKNALKESVIFDTLLLSGRIEMIDYYNAANTIRDTSKQKNRFYFNNIYINLEGDLSKDINYIVEFQPLTSELYLYGGFISVADSLEGMDPGDPGSRKRQIYDLINHHIGEIDNASQKPAFERVQIDFAINKMFNFQLGRVRNPFGFWDDYSVFRNLSIIRTDPISLGVPLRRTDMGGLVYGNLIDQLLTYEIGVLDGEYIFQNNDRNNKKDVVIKLGSSFFRLDFGLNYYIHDLDRDYGSSYAAGINLRYRVINDLTILGESVYIENKLYNVITRGGYLQLNYDLSGTLTEGLRLNMFFELYNSDLIKMVDEPGSASKNNGTYLQTSLGLIYTISRNIDIGCQIITGLDEEKEAILAGGLKIDAKF